METFEVGSFNRGKTYTKKQVVERLTDFLWERTDICMTYDYDELQDFIAEGIDTEPEFKLMEWFPKTNKK